MKNLKLQTVLPIAAFLLAGIGAFATQQTTSSQSNQDAALIDGFIRHSSSTDCEPISVDCTTQVTDQLCMTEEATPEQVWQKNGLGQCVIELYKTN
ncbi:DUF6520 family protein [Chishuiella sp.]|uniref:DUF6520 family protein n=1 Tax=Chishuiella sp. TaxID=1969467 RepID=UPI0028AB9788|nr:DUF6520 family protein [Chishuiella sp.]